MIEAKVVEVLLADASVVALVGNRVSPVVLRQEFGMPCIIYQRLAGDREYVLSGPAGWARADIGLTAWANEYAQARATADAVRKALDGYGDDEAGGIEVASVADSADLYEETLDVFGCGVTVSVQWQET